MSRWQLVAEHGIWLLVGAACAGDDDAATDAIAETGAPGDEVREDADASVDGETPDAPDDAGPDGIEDDGGSEIPIVPQPLGVVADRQDLVADQIDTPAPRGVVQHGRSCCPGSRIDSDPRSLPRT